MLVIGPHGRALRGDASIAPYIPFTDGTVGRGLDPSYAVCNDGNIYHLLHNKKSYVGGGVPDAPDGAYVIACGGQDPSLQTDGKRHPISKRSTAYTCGRIWNPPLRWRDAGCLTVVGADSISARPGRRRLAAKTMAAIRQSRPARAVQSPTGALIAARPRNAAPYKQRKHHT